MPKSSLNSSSPAATKEVKSAAPKRSLTPRRRAREYALQGVYQSLVVRRAGSLPNSAAITKQLVLHHIQWQIVDLMCIYLCK